MRKSTINSESSRVAGFEGRNSHIPSQGENDRLLLRVKVESGGFRNWGTRGREKATSAKTNKTEQDEKFETG